MRKLIFLISIIMLASCSSDKVTSSIIDQPERNVNFRARKMWFSTTTFSYFTDKAIKIINIDSAYRVGDTMEIKTGQFDVETFILLERVK